jgi:hypothetical protein
MIAWGVPWVKQQRRTTGHGGCNSASGATWECVSYFSCTTVTDVVWLKCRRCITAAPASVVAAMREPQRLDARRATFHCYTSGPACASQPTRSVHSRRPRLAPASHTRGGHLSSQTYVAEFASRCALPDCFDGQCGARHTWLTFSARSSSWRTAAGPSTRICTSYRHCRDAYPGAICPTDSTVTASSRRCQWVLLPILRSFWLPR